MELHFDSSVVIIKRIRRMWLYGNEKRRICFDVLLEKSHKYDRARQHSFEKKTSIFLIKFFLIVLSMCCHFYWTKCDCLDKMRFQAEKLFPNSNLKYTRSNLWWILNICSRWAPSFARNRTHLMKVHNGSYHCWNVFNYNNSIQRIFDALWIFWAENQTWIYCLHSDIIIRLRIKYFY